MKVRVLLDFWDWVCYWVVRLKLVPSHTCVFLLLQVNVVHLFGVLWFEFVNESVDGTPLIYWISFCWLEVRYVAEGTSIEFSVVFFPVWLSIAVEVVTLPYLYSIIRRTWHIINVSVAHYSWDVLFWET